MDAIPRREFLKKAAVAAATMAVSPRRLLASEEGFAARIAVVSGTDVARMMEAGIRELGGWAAFVRQGGKVAVKANVAWASLPEQGGNTHPALVDAVLRGCQAAGAAEIVLPENPCSPAKVSFEMSGIAAVARKAGVRLYEPKDDQDFVEVDIPRGQVLRKAEVIRDILECDCLINLPVAKTHSGAILTLGMKNWMGVVRDRRVWHRSGLHQCIADLSTRIRPNLIIVDATRIMVSNGPRGPGKLEITNQIIFGTDPVAVDAYAATLFGKDPFKVPYIQIAHDMGIGCGDLAKVDLQHLQT